MRLSAFIGLLLALPALQEVDMGHENKLSFCSFLINRRIYKQERLDGEGWCRVWRLPFPCPSISHILERGGKGGQLASYRSKNSVTGQKSHFKKREQ